ncbi:MAG: hypothetical protein RR092_08040, partial [Oscillospiraceae bacterium]
MAEGKSLFAKFLEFCPEKRIFDRKNKIMTKFSVCSEDCSEDCSEPFAKIRSSSEHSTKILMKGGNGFGSV